MQMALIKSSKHLVNRISISLPDELQVALDDMVNEVLVGTITILYDNGTRGLQEKIADLQYQYLDEVISSLHVNLVGKQTMEVMLVQGPAAKVQTIADEVITLRGVVTGKLQLLAALMPPIYS